MILLRNAKSVFLVLAVATRRLLHLSRAQTYAIEIGRTTAHWLRQNQGSRRISGCIAAVFIPIGATGTYPVHRNRQSTQNRLVVAVRATAHCERCGHRCCNDRRCSMNQRFSPDQVAKVFGVTKSTVIAWCESGTMPAVNVAGESAKRKRWRMSAEDIAVFEGRRHNSAPVTVQAKASRRTIARPTKDFFANSGGVR